MRIIDLTGTIIKERYCIIEQIGQGGQGRLFLARDMELGTLWAVKELPVEMKKEAKLMKMLSHPSLPKMTDYTEQEGFCYLVMEYIKGKTLGDYLKEGRIFSFEEILKIGIETSSALEYLHSRKPAVYYGDLKPDNLMLTDSGHLYLIDMGSAVCGYVERQRLCTGTVGYAAPEQFEGRITAVSDVYALGKTLSVLCDRNRIRYMLNRPGFGHFLLKCCRKEEKLRYQNVSAAKKKMEKLLKNSRNSILFLRLFFFFIVLFMGMGIYLADSLSEKLPMEEALSSVTEKYYEKEFFSGSNEIKKQTYESVEQELQQLLRKYPETVFQRKILLLLALNGELKGDPEHAAVYYEQILLYDGEFGEAYGRYGLFLCRQGLKEQSKRLWEQYCKLEAENKLEHMERKTLMIWEKKIGDGNT